MKKLFIVLAVASLGFAACNSNSTSKDQKKIDDSIAAKKLQDSLDAVKAAAIPVVTPAEMEAKKVADSIAAAAAAAMKK